MACRGRYSFMGIYYNEAELAPHRDNNQCEYTMSIQVPSPRFSPRAHLHAHTFQLRCDSARLGCSRRPSARLPVSTQLWPRRCSTRQPRGCPAQTHTGTQRTHARRTHARLCGTRRRHSQMENTLGCSVRSTACAGCMLHRVRRMLYRCCHARAACRDGCHGVRSRIAALHAPLHAVWSATVAHCRLLLVDAVSAW